MQTIILGSASLQPGTKFLVQPFRLDKASADEPAFFEVTILINAVRYQYGFQISADRITSEWLFVYFESIRMQNRLSSTHVHIMPSNLGTGCRQVVDSAKLYFEASRAFDKVFAVFDRDDHTTYLDALNYAKTLQRHLRNDEKKPITFMAIPSVPCFELWLLIHYQEIHAALQRTEVYSRLSTHIPGYKKGATTTYEITAPHLNLAIARARGLQTKFDCYSGIDPYTNVNEVVELLLSMQPSQRQ